ncbi:FGGY family carbohydrate kinase, partial [Pseudomonas aeruginosa]
LFNIHSQDWDEELLALFEIPRSLLPEVLDCAAEFGVSEPSLLGAAIPVLGMAGDEDAALHRVADLAVQTVADRGEQAVLRGHRLLAGALEHAAAAA